MGILQKKKIRKTVFCMAALTAAACLMTACGGTAAQNDAASAGAENSSSSKKVTMLLDWTPNTNHTGIYVAKELGYYEEAGLDVQIEMPGEASVTQLLGAGKGMFGISNTEDIIHAAALDDPMPVESVAAIIQHNTSGFVSLKEDGISSPADWSGKTYGGYGGASEEKIVRSIAADYGVDPDSIHFVDLGNSDVLTALKRDIDFIWVFEAAELISLDQQKVEYNYLPVRDYGDAFDYYTPVLAANTDVVEQDPQMAKDFVTATAKGYEYAIEHPEEAAEILLKAEPELDEYIVKNGQTYLAERYAKGAAQWGLQDEKVWKRYEEFMYENQLIDHQVDVSSIFTNGYLPGQEG